MTNKDLVEHLKNIRALKSKNIEEALLYVDRKDFVPKEYSNYAYVDDALPIGHGQTISQPFTVVFMLELLSPQKNQTILDVGFGSAWQTALLAHIAGENGQTHAVEVVPKVFEFGKRNLEKYSKLSKRVTFYCQNAKSNLPNTMFDRIIAAANITSVPSEWKRKLKVGGTMVYPSNHGIYKLIKKNEGDFESQFYPGFVFVPFV